MNDEFEDVCLTEARPEANEVGLAICFVVSSLAWCTSDALFFNPNLTSASYAFYDEDSFSEEA